MSHMKHRTRYGILDDFGEVIHWQWDKPSKNYQYVVQRVPAADWNNFEAAMF